MTSPTRHRSRTQLASGLLFAAPGILLLAGWLSPACAETFTATWIGPSGGSWSSALNWSTDEVPNNGPGDFYHVVIAANVDVDQTATVSTLRFDGNELVIENGRTLTVTGGAGPSCNGLCNTGSIVLNGTGLGAELEIATGVGAGSGDVEYAGNGSILYSNDVSNRFFTSGSHRLVWVGPSRLGVASFSPGGTGQFSVDVAFHDQGQQEAKLELTGLELLNATGSVVVGSEPLDEGGSIVISDSDVVARRPWVGPPRSAGAGISSLSVESGSLALIASGQLEHLLVELALPATLELQDASKLEDVGVLGLGTIVVPADVALTLEETGILGPTLELANGARLIGNGTLPNALAGTLELAAAAKLEGTGRFAVSGDLTVRPSAGAGARTTTPPTLEVLARIIFDEDRSTLAVEGSLMWFKYQSSGPADRALSLERESELWARQGGVVRLGLSPGTPWVRNRGFIGADGSGSSVVLAPLSTVEGAGEIAPGEIGGKNGGKVIGQGGLLVDGEISGTVVADPLLRICGTIELTASGELELRNGGDLRVDCEAVSPPPERTEISGQGELLVSGSGEIQGEPGSSLVLSSGRVRAAQPGDGITVGSSLGALEIFGELQALGAVLAARTVIKVCGGIGLEQGSSLLVLAQGILDGRGTGCSQRPGRRPRAPAGGVGRVAADSSSEVTLQFGSSMLGGELAASSTCMGCTLTDVTSSGTMTVPPNQQVTLSGAFHNRGRLLLGTADNGGDPRVRIRDDVVIDGGGTIEASATWVPRWTGESTSGGVASLVNEDNALRGEMEIGDRNAEVIAFTNRGLIDLEQATRFAFVTGDEPLVNEGTIRSAQGFANVSHNSGLVNPLGELRNRGTIEILDADFRSARLGASFLVQESGTLRVQGTAAGRVVQVRGGSFSAGEVSGQLSLSGGSFEIGDGVEEVLHNSRFNMSSGAVLVVDIGGTGAPGVDYDHLETSVFDFTTLGGTVWVRSVGGFEPRPGDQFPFFTYGDRQSESTFDAVFNGTPFPVSFGLRYDPGSQGQVTLETFSAAAGPDLEVTLEGPAGEVAPGAAIDYRIDLVNDPTHGNQSASQVTLTHELPAGSTFVSATPASGSCSAAGGIVTCALPGLGLGAGTSVEVRVQLGPQEGVLETAATVASPEAERVPVDNTAVELTTVDADVFADGFESGDISAW